MTPRVLSSGRPPFHPQWCASLLLSLPLWTGADCGKSPLWQPGCLAVPVLLSGPPEPCPQRRPWLWAPCSPSGSRCPALEAASPWGLRCVQQGHRAGSVRFLQNRARPGPPLGGFLTGFYFSSAWLWRCLRALKTALCPHVSAATRGSSRLAGHLRSNLCSLLLTAPQTSNESHPVLPCFSFHFR